MTSRCGRRLKNTWIRTKTDLSQKQITIGLQDFENVTLRGILAFNILETKSEVKNKLISDSVTGSPKTGTHGVGLVFSIITVSGTIAFITL